MIAAAEVNPAMTGKENRIGKYTVIFHKAIMPDMGRRHKQVAVTDPGGPPTLGSSAVDSNSLAKGVAIAYLNSGRLPPIAQILGRSPDHRTGMNDVLCTENCGPLENCVFTNQAAVTNCN